MPSTFTEDAKWRQENEVWLKWSCGVAMSIVDYMQENGQSRSDVAAKLGVSPQYVSRILYDHTYEPRPLGVDLMSRCNTELYRKHKTDPGSTDLPSLCEEAGA